ncbi:MAG: hypothetical protein JO328_08855 [Hyphomicrobiales bacterium]|nr:hypothetical protein [Hyphomicrobiales bacterium]MBV9429667.1 hypothetical protein [Bradyrhizobiaceae bacterium]
MPGVAEEILKEVEKLPEGAVIRAKEFLHLGTRDAVDQAIKRLKDRNELMRIYPGAYVRPIKTRFGYRAPAPEKVVEGIAATTAETIVAHGAAAANSLGLTTQVPIKLVYLTSGRTRTFKLGAQVVELKRSSQWKLLPSHRAAGEAVRALDWIGERRAAQALTTLKQTLPESTIQDLIRLRPALPAWMSKSISQALVSHG